MKKFVFSLQSVLEYRQTVETNQKAQLAEARAILTRLEDELRRIDRDTQRAMAGRDRALSARKAVLLRLREYEVYLEALRESRENQLQLIERQSDELERIRGELVKTMKEVKALERLKEEQYAKYQEEVRQEEEKELGDIVNFKVVS